MTLVKLVSQPLGARGCSSALVCSVIQMSLGCRAVHWRIQHPEGLTDVGLPFLPYFHDMTWKGLTLNIQLVAYSLAVNFFFICKIG